MITQRCHLYLIYLRDANVDTQAEGWHFNTEKHVKFTPDANGKIAISNDILSMDLHDNQARRHMTLYVVMDFCMTR